MYRCPLLSVIFVVILTLIPSPGLRAQADFWEPLPGIYGQPFIGEDHALYVIGSVLQRSTDDGTSWDTIPIPPGYGAHAFFADSDGTLFVGIDYALYRSTNDGASWVELALPVTAEVTAFAASGIGVYYAGVRLGNGLGELYTSADRGVSWTKATLVTRWLQQGRGADRFIYDMVRTRSGMVYMGHSMGGAAFSVNKSPWARSMRMRRTRTIVFGRSDDDEAVAVIRSQYYGTGGFLFRSRFGDTRGWKRFDRKQIPVAVWSIARNLGAYYAGTLNGVYRSTDNGTSWELITSGFPGSPMPVDKVVAGERLFAQIGSGYVYRSTSLLAAAPRPAFVEGEEIPEPLRYALLQNFPNPFNPATTIPFDLREDSYVSLKIFNVLGQEVATLLDHELLDAGEQEAEFDAGSLPSGIYVCRIAAAPAGVADGSSSSPGFAATVRMILMR